MFFSSRMYNSVTLSKYWAITSSVNIHETKTRKLPSLKLKLQDIWASEHQVLRNRIHPLMYMSSHSRYLQVSKSNDILFILWTVKIVLYYHSVDIHMVIRFSVKGFVILICCHSYRLAWVHLMPSWENWYRMQECYYHLNLTLIIVAATIVCLPFILALIRLIAFVYWPI